MKIKIAHSPDSDDAFMFYALAENKIPADGMECEHVLRDIETLNREALKGTYEITAVSIHAYAYLTDKYTLLGSGASMGEGYGPMVVATQNLSIADLSGKKIAVPGKMTSAFLALQMLVSDFEPIVMPFDEIIAAVKAGTVDAGLIIHEGQLYYGEEGLKLVVDMGKWWKDKTGLPLPLGGNAVRRDLGPQVMKRLARLQRASIAYGLENRKAALTHSMQYARGLDPAKADKFVGMYVNSRTLEYGDEGRKAVKLFLDMAFEKGLIPHQVPVEFVDEN